MGIWQERADILRGIQQNVIETATDGQQQTLGALILEMETQDIMPRPNTRRIRSLTNELSLGQHFKNEAFTEFVHQVFPPQKPKGEK